jgi:hypothetical protein
MRNVSSPSIHSKSNAKPKPKSKSKPHKKKEMASPKQTIGLSSSVSQVTAPYSKNCRKYG